MRNLDKRLKKIERRTSAPTIYEWREAARHGMTPEEWRDAKAFWIWWQERYHDEDDIQDTPEDLWAIYQVVREWHIEGPFPVVDDGVVRMAIFEGGVPVQCAEPGEEVDIW
jgi:hypothetical protein